MVDPKETEVIKQKAAEFASALPSRVIEMAVDDLEAVERLAAKYRIDMDHWHRAPKPGEPTCAVCFAGAVMANRLGVDIGNDVAPHDFDSVTEDRLLALDDFRSGYVHAGLATFNPETDEPPEGVLEEMEVVEYGDDPARFKADMRSMAEMLKKAGL